MPLYEAGWLASAGLGSVVGLILALTGAGGAIVAVPLLIFGATADQPGALKLLGAVSLLLVAGCPFVAGAAVRMGRS